MTATASIPYVSSGDRAEILRAVIKVIENEPLRYSQHTYRATPDDKDHVPIATWPTCRTVCCIAGWICAVTHPEGIAGIPPRYEISDRAKEAIGMVNSEGLFAASALDAYELRQGTPEYAAAGVKFIKAFARTHLGIEL